VAQRSEQILGADRLGTLIEALARKGYEVVGPTVRDGAIVYDHIELLDDLPKGWTDEQNPGYYRLKRRDDEALFGYAVGPQSWKKYTHPPEVRLWTAERQETTFRILNNDEKYKRPRAFLGARSCELAAIGVQDRVLLEDKYRDPIYDRLSLTKIPCGALMGFSVRTVTRRAARVANLRTEPENVRTSEHRCSGCRRNRRLNIMSTYPIFRLLVVRSDGAVHPLGERPRPARFRVAEPGAFRVSLSPGIGAFWIGGNSRNKKQGSDVASPH